MGMIWNQIISIYDLKSDAMIFDFDFNSFCDQWFLIWNRIVYDFVISS